jgi:ribose-phosphate pyrophosphokinase
MSISNLENMVLISSTKEDEFAGKISDFLYKPLAKVDPTKFKDTDIKLRVAESESVRGKDVFLITTYYPPISDRLQELVIWTDSIMRGAAERLTYVIPNLPGGRQDRKTRRGEPINAAAYIHALQGVAQEEASKLGWITSDLHAPQLQIAAMRFDELTATPLFAEHIKNNHNTEEVVIISPDSGGLKRAEKLAGLIGVEELSWVAKIRNENTGDVKDYGLSGDSVKDKSVILYDDIVDSGGTLLTACNLLKDAGAKDISVYATHLILSNPAEENLSRLDDVKIVGTDSIYHPKSKIDKLGLTRLPISYFFAEAIERQHLGISTKELHTKDATEIIKKRYQASTRISDSSKNLFE